MKIIKDEKLKHKVLKTINNNYENFNEDKFYEIIRNKEDILYHLIKDIPIKFKKDNLFSENRYSLIFKNIKNIKPKIESIVDVGAHNGEITQKFQKEFKINKKKTFLIDKVKPKKINCSHYKYYSSTKKIKSNSIDLVICFMTLHHIKECEETIKDINRILKQGGLFILRESDNGDEDDINYHKIMDTIYFNWHNNCEINNNFYYKSKYKWIEIIENNNFYIRKIESPEIKNYFKPFHGYFIKK